MKIPTLPHILKYMGSKREILSFVIDTIQKTGVESNYFCDLFAGTALVGSAFKHQYRIHINDIQSYSSIFAQAYLYNLKTAAQPGIIGTIHDKASSFVSDLISHTPELIADYSTITELTTLKKLVMRDGKHVLASINPAYKDITPIDGEGRITGIFFETLEDYRKL